MEEFKVSLRSFQQVQDFVSLSSAQSYPILVGNNGQDISAKDLMGMFSLDYSRPIRVRAECSAEEVGPFLEQLERFTV